MRISPAWLREFVEIKADDRQLAEGLTSAGIAVESVVNNGSVFTLILPAQKTTESTPITETKVEAAP